MTLHLLDSDAIVDFLKGIQSTTAFIQALPAQGHIACSCDQTTELAAQKSGIWRYDFARRGVTLPTTDTLIAAVAAEHGADVVTGNVKDYPMSDVTVVPLPRVQRGLRS